MSRAYRDGGKRVLDVAIALASLVVLSPVLAVVALLIKREDGGRVIFRQRRIGRGQRPFELLKFRSMRENVGDVPSTQAGGLPVTRIGSVIRRTNLDELPQLVNILRGDMSVVGPRPALASQTELIALRASNGAFDVRPGLTGLAQVSAYDGMPATEKARCDATYAQAITLLGDLTIIWRTFGYLRRPPPVY
ncbi:MAG: sugar transferase [Gemmatimonadetes bacterium]|nr:sugar transferase [Gemmatimonadota bacterium]